jgi:hypothetical protein
MYAASKALSNLLLSFCHLVVVRLARGILNLFKQQSDVIYFRNGNFNSSRKDAITLSLLCLLSSPAIARCDYLVPPVSLELTCYCHMPLLRH